MGGLQLFTIAGIPVRVSLWYGLLLLYWFRDGSAQANLLWAAIVTISILVHELGHAMVARYLRLRPSILIHGLGGLCQHDRAERDLHDVFVIAAGPLAGLLLGGATWLFKVMAPELAASPEYPWIETAVRMSLWVNILWSLVNLLPLWPLDGGQLFRLGMLRLFPPKRADQITHYTALALLGGALALGFAQGTSLLILLVIWIGWSNIAALRGQTASGPIRTTNKLAKELLAQAVAAYDRGDFTEAARVCYQIRAEANVADKVMREMWRVLGVSAARLGDHLDALTFLRRATPSTEVTEARIECLYALGRDRELKELLDSSDFQQIGRERQEEILGVVRSGA